jgi:gas vesicle protein
MSDDRGGFGDAMGVIGTLLLGAAIGAGVALLMAPKSGAELREDLRSRADRVGDDLTDVTHKATESVKAQVERLGEKAEELTKKAEELGTRLTKKADEAKEA